MGHEFVLSDRQLRIPDSFFVDALCYDAAVFAVFTAACVGLLVAVIVMRTQATNLK